MLRELKTILGNLMADFINHEIAAKSFEVNEPYTHMPPDPKDRTARYVS